MPHSAEQEDMPWHYFQHAAGRGDRIAASILLRSGTGSELSVSHDNTPSIGCVRCTSDPAPIVARHPGAPCTFESLTVLTVTDSEKVRPSRQSSAPCLGGKPPRCQLLVLPCGHQEQPASRPQTPKCGSAASASLAHRNAISLPCCSIRHAGALALQPPAAPGSTPALANAQGTPGTYRLPRPPR
jgi:hypothetical protein